MTRLLPQPIQRERSGDVATGAPVALARVLGRWQLVGLGIGAIIGSGIFVIPGVAAAQFAGPAIVISFLIAALACLFSGLCYAELAAMYPVTGSAYTYASRAFGPFVGWLIGWLLVLEYLFAAAIIAVGWSGYLVRLLGEIGVVIPDAIARSPVAVAADGHIEIGAGLADVPAIAVVVAGALVALREIRLPAAVNAAITVLKVSVVLVVVLACLPFVQIAHWTPFIPPNNGHWGEYGWSGVLRGAAVVFYVYLGFDTVSVAAQEARNPQRDIPFGIIGSLLVCTALFVPVAFVMTGLTDYRNLNVAYPLAIALEAAGPQVRWLAPVVDVGAMIGMFSVLLVVLVAVSRILYAMANDGLMPAVFGRLHPVLRTPVAGTLLCALGAIIAAALLPIGLLGQMVSIGVLLAFIGVCAAVIWLRRRAPEMLRPFRTPFVPLVPIGGILVCAYMIAGLPLLTWIRFAVWMALGLGVYARYRNRRAPSASE